MSKIIVSEVLLSLLLVAICTVLFNVQSAKAEVKTIKVPDDYPTIQGAINAANPGDTIFVKARTYYENLVVNKTVILIGESRRNTVIDGHAAKIVVNVTSSGVVIKGFTIRNGMWNSGIYAYGCSNVTIQNNTLANNADGVFLSGTSSSTITENTIVANQYNGISFDSSVNNTISGNTISRTAYYGVYLDASTNNTICKNEIINNEYCGIYLYSSSNNTLYENNIANNGPEISWGYGIFLNAAHNNTIFRNNIVDNTINVYFSSSDSNHVIGNNITNGWYGIQISIGSNSIFHHNNFMNNRRQAYDWGENVWDDGYPSGGNYWSDYSSVDENSGPCQNETGSDGIGDMPHYAYFRIVDNYPLVDPIEMFDAGLWNGQPCFIYIVSNSKVSDFHLDTLEKTISFNVDVMNCTSSFCRVTIPNVIIHYMWPSNYTVLVNGESSLFRNWTDTTNTYIYIDCVHPENQVIIVPEFPLTVILPLFLILSIVATALTKQRFPRKPS